MSYATDFCNQLNSMATLLKAKAFNLTQNTEDAKDLYQETAYRAMANMDKFHPGTNFRAWLFTIMKNIFINDYRKKIKANTLIDSTPELYYINSGVNVTSNLAESSLVMKELVQIIDKLDDGIRIPFLMYHQGYKYQEIADYLDLPLGTVKSRIFFARRDLRGMIGNRYNDMKLDMEG